MREKLCVMQKVKIEGVKQRVDVLSTNFPDVEFRKKSKEEIETFLCKNINAADPVVELRTRLLFITMTLSKPVS